MNLITYLASAACCDRMCLLKIFSDSEVKSQNRQSTSSAMPFPSSVLALALAFAPRALFDLFLPLPFTALALAPCTCLDLVFFFGIFDARCLYRALRVGCSFSFDSLESRDNNVQGTVQVLEQLENWHLSRQGPSNLFERVQPRYIY